MSRFKQLIKSIILILTILLLLTSCAISIYQPNLAYNPVIRGKYHVDVNGTIGTSGNSLAGAFSFNKFLFLAGNYSTYTTSDGTVKYGYFRQNLHNKTDVYLGFYKKLSKKENSYADYNVPIYFNLLAGYGFGNGKNYTFYGGTDSGREDGRFVEGDFNAFIIQPAIQIQNRSFHLSTGVRLQFMQYENFNQYNYDYRNLRVKSSSLNNSLSISFFEPYGQIDVGYHYIYAFVQGGLSLPSMSSENVYPAFKIFLNAGLRLNIAPIEIMESIKLKKVQKIDE